MSHQQVHLFDSSVFYVKQQAFHGTTLILRKNLAENSVSDFDIIYSDDCVEEIEKIIAREIVKKFSMIFSIAVTINFTKFDTDGSIISRVAPCFTSSQKYINNVSSYSTKIIIHELVLELKKRFDDFNENGSGWSLESFAYFDLHISQVNDLRGGCGNLLSTALRQKLLSRRTGLLNICNTDNRCVLYCIEASFICQNQWPAENKADPSNYVEFVDILKTGNTLKSVIFPISLDDILFLEEVNRKSINPIEFIINVFKEDAISHQIQLIRRSPYRDGKTVNLLMIEFQHAGKEIAHFILVYKSSLLKKRYVNPQTKKISLSNTIFCDI